MTTRKTSPWVDFWHNLKEGHDAFERNKIPPTPMPATANMSFQTTIIAKPLPVGDHN